MALDLADASKDDLKILLSNPALLVNIGLQGQGLWTEIQRISKELAAKEYVPLDLAKASQDDLKILLANPALLGLQGQDLVDEIERISKALVQKAAAAAPKQKVEITFDVHEHHFIAGDVNYLFYVLVDGNGTFHTNLTQPDLLAIQGETDYRNAGFHHGNIGLRKKTFDVSGDEGYLLVFSDRYSGIEEKTKQVASVLLASNKLKDLKFGEDAISWKPEIEEAGKYLAKIAKSTPLGDYSEAVNEATSLIVALYTYIKEHNFKAVARVLRFSPPPVPLPAGVNGPPPERAPLYTYPPGGKVKAQVVDLHLHSGHPKASFKIKSVTPDPAPVLPVNPVRYHKAQRARRFYQQNLLNEPAWVTNILAQPPAPVLAPAPVPEDS